MHHPDKRQWCIWRVFDVYSEVLKESSDLARATGDIVVFMPWEGGWAIDGHWNLLEIRREKLEAAAESEERYREGIDDYHARQSREEVDELISDLQDDFARSDEDGWFYGD